MGKSAVMDKSVSEPMALGRQMTVEYYECSTEILADSVRLEQAFLTAARLSGATVVNSTFHSFTPQGVSGVIVISESHFAVHAWPEHDYAAVDLFTCGNGVDFDVAVREIAKGIGSGQWIVSSFMNRGILRESGIERLVPVSESQECRWLQLSWRERFDRSHARALSASIDVYRIKKVDLNSETALREFAVELSSRLCGGAAPGQWGYSAVGDEAEFAQDFPCGHVYGLVCKSAGTIYLDVFVNGFFDPRSAAEFAMEELGGAFYRMQPQVRQ